MLVARQLACLRGEALLYRGLDVELPRGALLWVEGDNGSGKTSLLRQLCGLALPDAGSVSWDGADVRTERERFAAQCLYLGHANALKDDLTIAENLRAAARIGGLDASEPALDRALDATGLASRRDLPVRVLSQGQRRRAALARLWLAAGRPLWVLDEPFVALDAASVDRLAAHVAAHVADGGAVVLTTHQPVALPDAGRTRRLRLDA
jgi:heme exporter protein A